MSENWAADARVGVPMFQVIAKQVSQYKHRPRTVRQIIDQQWLDETSKQQLREIFHVTDADLLRHEREAAMEARRRTRARYGVPVPAGPCQCDAEPVVHPSGRIECGSCGTEWAKPEVRQVIDAQWLDEASKQQLRESFQVTDADLSALDNTDRSGDRPAGPGTRTGSPARSGARVSKPADRPDPGARASKPADRPDPGTHASKPAGRPADPGDPSTGPVDRSGSPGGGRPARRPQPDSEDGASDAA